MCGSVRRPPDGDAFSFGMIGQEVLGIIEPIHESWRQDEENE